MFLLACFFSLLPGPQSSVQLVKPGSSSFVAPSDSMSCCRSCNDLTFFIYPLLLALAPEPWSRDQEDFTNLLHREISKRGQDCIISFKILQVKPVCACLSTHNLYFFFWPSVPGCILFGSIPGRHRLTPGPTPSPLRLGSSIAICRWIWDQGSSLAKRPNINL